MTKEKGLPLTSTHWGTYRAKVKDGKVQELIGWEHDKDPSPIGPGILDVQDGPTRIDAPMIRKSWLEGGPGTRNKNRGTDSFIEVSWDKANQLVADELNRVKDKYGNSSIFGGVGPLLKPPSPLPLPPGGVPQGLWFLKSFIRHSI